MDKLTAADVAALDRRLKARGRPLKFDVDSVPEWGVFVVPEHLEGAALLSAVKSVQAAGKRRGWIFSRTGTHRLVRIGTGRRPDPVQESF